MERIKDSVLPSGVAFSVRNLIGEDQDDLTRAAKKGESGQSTFNKMLAGAMRKLGDKSEGEITPKDIARMLSNDRKFALVTLRQHTLEYKPTFDFKYEWPIQKGQKKKVVQDYSVDFDHENFPVKPYYWMVEKIREMQKDNPGFKPDGHIIPFPMLYSSYADMLEQNRIITGEFRNGMKYKWELLNGEIELEYASTMSEDMRMNLMIEMRKPKYLFTSDKDGKETWAMFEPGKVDVSILEDLRFEIFEKEGSVDTSLAIAHPTDRLMEKRVDLTQLPAFFFPSMAR